MGIPPPHATHLYFGLQTQFGLNGHSCSNVPFERTRDPKGLESEYSAEQFTQRLSMQTYTLDRSWHSLQSVSHIALVDDGGAELIGQDLLG